MTSPDPIDESSSNQDPVRLDYYPAHAPDARRGRAATYWAMVLLAGWAPYLCGVVNASTLAIAYTPPIIAAHQNGAVLFMGIGILVSVAGLIGFAMLKHAVGIGAGVIVLAMQIVMSVCAGLAV